MTTTISKTVFFAARLDTVWDFLTDKEKLGQWYHPAENNLADGEDYALLSEGDDGKMKTLIWGRVVEMTPPTKLVTTMCIDPFDGKETTVTWVLEPAVGGTRLSLSHEGIAEATGAAAIHLLTALDAGWDRHFAQLREATT